MAAKSKAAPKKGGKKAASKGKPFGGKQSMPFGKADKSAKAGKGKKGKC